MNHSIRIVIAALGGEGGGVLAKWIADTAAREGFISQTTSVPGVAQRTGATIYYIELIPRKDAEQAQKQPVMSMFPAPGDVDLVICSEIVEAGRMVQRGFVTPDRTTLITSTHRTYGIAEKSAMADGITDKEAIVEICRANAKSYIGFDMQQTAASFDSVINSVLFGALAETGVLPFDRSSLEETIRLSKVAVENNLKTFAAGFNLAADQQTPIVGYIDPKSDNTEGEFELPKATTNEGQKLLSRIAALPKSSQEFAFLGVSKLVQYQDFDYAGLYLTRLESFQKIEGDGSLIKELSRYLSLWMAFEDLPRVAQLKISAERFARFREEVKATPEQAVSMVEFLHPRIEEFCGVMPVAIGQFVLNSKPLSRFLGFFAKPRNIKTNSIHGYLAFYLLAKLRRFRRSSLIYQQEQTHIEEWLNAVRDVALRDYSAATALASCGRLTKGYGSTRERGQRNLNKLIAITLKNKLDATAIENLKNCALADDLSEALDNSIAQIALPT